MVAKKTQPQPTALDRKVVREGNIREWTAVLDTRMEECKALFRGLLETFGKEDLTKHDIDLLVHWTEGQTQTFDTDLGATLANMCLLTANQIHLKAVKASYGL